MLLPLHNSNLQVITQVTENNFTTASQCQVPARCVPRSSAFCIVITLKHVQPRGCCDISLYIHSMQACWVVLYKRCKGSQAAVMPSDLGGLIVGMVAEACNPSKPAFPQTPVRN